MPSDANIHETDGGSVTVGLPISGLRGLRNKYGPKSAIGHHSSNIEELLNQPSPPVALLQWQMASLAKLLKAA